LNESNVNKIKFFSHSKALKFIGGQRIGVIERGKNSGADPKIILTIDDNDFVRLSYNTIKLEDVIDIFIFLNLFIIYEIVIYIINHF
jgi:hypothetical protein